LIRPHSAELYGQHSNGKFFKAAKAVAIMREIDAHFDAYEHLKHLPRDGEALHMLRKAASMVKPMMRKRGWKVGTLAEFLPDEPQLLGRYHHIWTKSCS
jgi:hypothetical protein